MAETKNIFETVPVETAVELLVFMADHQDFSGVVGAMNKRLTAAQIRKVLKEVASYVRDTAGAQDEAQGLKGVSQKSKDVLSTLSSDESAKLLNNLGFTTD